MKKMIFVVMILMFFLGRFSWANNLDISETAIESQNPSAGTVTLEFDLSWENSWRDSVNYDAVWVWVKYSTDGGSAWNHATMKQSGTDPSGFSSGSGTALEILVPTDKKGCFFQRDGGGSGSVSATSVQLVWDYSYDGVSDDQANSQDTQIKIFSCEMVYVPTASFYIGDGNALIESAEAFHVTDNTSAQITANPLSNVTVDSNVVDDIDTSPITLDGEDGITGNSSWPTGYEAFYLMKYEITEGQWVEFFNTLTSEQKSMRDITSASGKNSDLVVNRNTVSWVSGEALTDRPDRACSFLSWQDVCAFADWAALRPMTELEYEKASRGTASSVTSEYTWGSASITAVSAFSGSENGTETVSTVGANANYGGASFSGGDGGSGSMRVGILATVSSTRVQAGAGYYGNMELSGNLAERCVSLGVSSGRAFMGSEGDGVLTSTAGYEGNASNLDWPGIDSVNSRGVTGAAGSGFRGGAWSDVSSALIVSNRSVASSADTTRTSAYGGRAARTA